MRQTFFVVVCSIFLVACTHTKKIAVTNRVSPINALKFLGQYEMPYDMSYNNTTVGGLSGIDYDGANDDYYMICDDRSDKNPARFYKAKIYISAKGIDSMRFIGMQYMLQPNNAVYPNKLQDRKNTPDPEAMRYNPVLKELTWSSEGERIVKETDTVLANPSIIAMATNGTFKAAYELPENLLMHATQKGPRQNGVLEGMSFADNFTSLFVNVEEPLYEDGPRADITDNNAYIRILKFDVATKKNIAQYAYKLDPLAHPANPVTSFKINGVPDILSIDHNTLLIMERSFSTGRPDCTVKVFISALDNATDVKNMASLKANTAFIPVTKKLLLNMDNLGIYIDNVEGVTFGPVLPNGHRTLLFVADNNFSKEEKAQLLLFEVIE